MPALTSIPTATSRTPSGSPHRAPASHAQREPARCPARTPSSLLQAATRCAAELHPTHNETISQKISSRCCNHRIFLAQFTHSLKTRYGTGIDRPLLMIGREALAGCSLKTRLDTLASETLSEAHVMGSSSSPYREHSTLSRNKQHRRIAMRSEYTANRLLAATPSTRVHRATPNTRTIARYPQRRTVWGFIFFWL